MFFSVILCTISIPITILTKHIMTWFWTKKIIQTTILIKHTFYINQPQQKWFFQNHNNYHKDKHPLTWSRNNIFWLTHKKGGEIAWQIWIHPHKNRREGTQVRDFRYNIHSNYTLKHYCYNSILTLFFLCIFKKLKKNKNKK